MNCRILAKPFDDLKDFLININSNNKFDVIPISETWLMPNKHDLSDFVLDRYILYIPRLEMIKLYFCIEIAVKNRKVHISYIYRAPN